MFLYWLHTAAQTYIENTEYDEHTTSGRQLSNTQCTNIIFVTHTHVNQYLRTSLLYEKGEANFTAVIQTYCNPRTTSYHC